MPRANSYEDIFVLLSLVFFRYAPTDAAIHQERSWEELAKNYDIEVQQRPKGLEVPVQQRHQHRQHLPLISEEDEHDVIRSQ